MYRTTKGMKGRAQEELAAVAFAVAPEAAEPVVERSVRVPGG
jgi:hypothetical protein